MGRWRCVGISQQWVGDVAAAQGGTSVQLYCKALKVIYVCNLVTISGHVPHIVWKVENSFKLNVVELSYIWLTPVYRCKHNM